MAILQSKTGLQFYEPSYPIPFAEYDDLLEKFDKRLGEIFTLAGVHSLEELYKWVEQKTQEEIHGRDHYHL